MSGNPPYHNLTYYTFNTPNGLKPAIVLEELGLDYKAEEVSIVKNAQKEDWFLAINPNGRIPALKDGEQRIFETGAIMLYLTDNYDKENKISYPHGTREYYEMLSWLMWQMGGLGPMQVGSLPTFLTFLTLGIAIFDLTKYSDIGTSQPLPRHGRRLLRLQHQALHG